MEHDKFSENYQKLKSQAREAPLEAGVYIMRDEDGRIIYVGKARILRNRLVSYFSGAKDIKTHTLMRTVWSIETIIVSNEYEALLLENTLIKQHSPKYNINLKDGKTYPVIRITTGEFPRVFRTRHIVEDGSEYFGPFSNIPAVDALLELIERLFPLRKCRILKKRNHPCMYYHIGRCSAPCCGRISAGEYAAHIEKVRKLVSGETEALIAGLKADMKEAAGKLLFERAARLRDAIGALENFASDNAVEDFDSEGRDYIAWAEEGVLTTYTVFSMRSGKMTGRELYRTCSAAGQDESLETFLISYYSPARPPPPKIFLEARPGGYAGETVPEVEAPALAGWFRAQFGYVCEIHIPEEKHHKAILALARQNAGEDLRKRLKERGAGPALDELAEVLKLKTRPERIEGFDIAQLDGRYPVASLISFRNGVPDRKNYRHFRLRSVVGIVDDFAAMREAVSRRYSRLLREGKELPDLILIDGGIGQVNAARGILDGLGMDIDIVGLAKREEELWLPLAKEPIRLSRRSEALKVLQFVRDETHRFATGLNQKLRSKDLSLSVLESVEDIGPKRALALLEEFGSLKALVKAEAAEISGRANISETAARAARAAARLALEDREKREKDFAAHSPDRRGAGSRRGSLGLRSEAIGAALAEEAAGAKRPAGNISQSGQAAEKTAEYLHDEPEA
ncbi:MAG: excinuclease ABC subunit UvrC [Spirochaetaceae bacterium]|jgi:excinuclease ABC subunit C|nr:excinuclease ABC subunit UvrC [Spirochaetaceae bacterium]